MNAIAHASAMPATGPQLDNRRVLAGVIDLLVLAAGAAVIFLAARALGGGDAEFTPALGVVVLGWALYYYFACESGGGQTLGKRAMGLRVVRPDGSHADMREIFVRTILRVVDGLFLYLVGLVAMLLSGQRRQRLGDMAAGTIVVDARAAAPTVTPAVVMPEPVVEDERAPHPGGISLPEAPPVPELKPFDPEPVVEAEPEPVVEAEPEPVVEVEPEPVVEPEPEPVVEVEPEPVVEVEPEPVVEVEPEPVVEPEPEPPALGYDPAVESAPTEPLPGTSPEDIVTPSLKELAADVAAAAVPVPQPVEVGEEPVPLPAPEPVAEEPVDEAPEDDEPVVVKSVETVSAMDLLMEETEADDDSREDRQLG
jgi:uncharacterized RDD family membrane protein YckC